MSLLLWHERHEPALALLILAPLNHLLFEATAPLHPSVTGAGQVDGSESLEFRSLAPFSRPWITRLLILCSICLVATLALTVWPGSLSTDELRRAPAWQFMALCGVLVVTSFFLYAPLARTFRKFIDSAHLSDARVWSGLTSGLSVWLWSDAAFAGVYQQLSLACASPRAALCGGQPAFSGSLSSFGDAFYFSTATMATVGYGDIVPASAIARYMVSAEIILGIGLLGFILARAAGITPRSAS